MHLDALKYYLYVIEEKSISKAAKKAHISQSALSQMIHKLEEDLGYELLKRSNRGVSMTPFGEVVLKYANNMIKNFDKMVDDLEDLALNHNKVIITGTWSLSLYSLPCMMYRIKKRFPEQFFELHTKNVDEIVSDTKNDLCDFGFVDTIIEDDTLVYHTMGKEQVVLIAKKDYKVKDTITLSDLLDIEMIMCTMNKKTCEHLEDALSKRNRSLDDLNIIFNADALTAVKSSVMNGYGMAFVPYESIKHELYEQSIKLVQVEDLDLDYTIYMVSKKPKDLTQAARESRAYLIEIGRKSFC